MSICSSTTLKSCTYSCCDYRGFCPSCSTDCIKFSSGNIYTIQTKSKCQVTPVTDSSVATINISVWVVVGSIAIIALIAYCIYKRFRANQQQQQANNVQSNAQIGYPSSYQPQQQPYQDPNVPYNSAQAYPQQPYQQPYPQQPYPQQPYPQQTYPQQYVPGYSDPYQQPGYPDPYQQPISPNPYPQQPYQYDPNQPQPMYPIPGQVPGQYPGTYPAQPQPIQVNLR